MLKNLAPISILSISYIVVSLLFLTFDHPVTAAVIALNGISLSVLATKE